MQYWGRTDDVLEKPRAGCEKVRHNCGRWYTANYGGDELENQTCGSETGVATY
jgi:hypothetical protein